LIAARDEVLAGAGLAGAILAGRLLHGLSVAGIHPVLQSWASRLTGAADRLRGLARLSAGLNIGRLIGPALAAAAIWHPLLPFILIAFLALPGLLVLAALPSVKAVPIDSPAAPLACRPRGFDWSPVSGFLLTLMVGQIYGILGLYLQAVASLSDGDATAVMGGILSAAALAGLGVQILIIPRLNLDAKRHHGPIAAFSSIFIVILGALAPILAEGIGGGIVSACLLSVGATLLAALMTARVSLRAALGRLGRAAGRQSAAQTAGYAAGAALGGFLFQLLPTAPFWCAAVVGLFLLASEHMDQRGDLKDAAGV
jgi:predicted MFS family arabinose efflux permease